jgi:hypothetical protein
MDLDQAPFSCLFPPQKRTLWQRRDELLAISLAGSSHPICQSVPSLPRSTAHIAGESHKNWSGWEPTRYLMDGSTAVCPETATQ